MPAPDAPAQMQAPVSITKATAFLAANGYKRDRSRIQRFVSDRPHLIVAYKKPDTQRGPLVDPAAVLAAFANDYTRQLHSGEATGQRPSSSANQEAPAPIASPASSPPMPDAPTPVVKQSLTSDPTQQADDPAKQKVREQNRKLMRENAEAEALLAPVAEIHAVLADIVPETQQAFARIRQKHAEKIAAALNQPAAVVTLTAALDEYTAAAFNRLAARMAERTVGEDPAAQARFTALIEFATQLHDAPDYPANDLAQTG